MSHCYRCTHDGCRLRVALLHRLEWYKRPPKCKGCGRPLDGKEDKAVKKQRKKLRCDCSGHHYPHRRGSKWCNEYRGTYSKHDLQSRNLE